MKYLGSKNRIAKHILPIILRDRIDGQYYVEPFVGGANMIDKVDGNRIGGDINEYLIALLNKMMSPKFEPPEIDEVEYNIIKNNIDKYPKWVVGYAAFQLSFGSMWFNACRRDKQGKRNYCKEARNNITKQSKNLKGITFVNSSYEKLDIPKNSIIYCDPPYQNTVKYKDVIDYDVFWQWCRDMNKQKSH